MQALYCLQCGTSLSQKFLHGRTRRYCPHCGWIHYINPLPVALAVVMNSDNEILLVKRGEAPKVGKWCFPCGYMEGDEFPETAALRELKEETGLCGTINRFLTVIGSHSELTPGQNVVIQAYYITVNDFSLLKAGDDAQDAAFFPITDYPALAFEAHTEILRTFKKILQI